MARQSKAISALEHSNLLAEHLPAFEPCEPALEFRKRHLGIDHWKKAGCHFGKALADITERTAERSEDPILLQIKLEQIHCDRLSRGRSAGNQAAAALEAEQRAIEGVRADMFEGDIDAFFAGQFAHQA